MKIRAHITKKMQRILCLFASAVALLLFQSNADAQDVQFSIPSLVPLYINPASSGEFDMYRANLNYRSQWKAVGSPFTTISGSFDMVVLGSTGSRGATKGRLATGINFLTDKSGSDGQKLTSVNASAAYHVQLTQNSTLGGGLNIGFDQRVFSFENAKWGSQFDGVQYDPNISSGESFGGDTESCLDLGGGIIYHASKPSGKRGVKLNREISIGLSAYHLGRIKLSESQYLSEGLSARYSGFAKVQIPVLERLAAIPQCYLQIQNGSNTFLYGLSAKYAVIADDSFMEDTEPLSVQLGLFLRNNNSMVINTGMEWSKYTLALAYDLSIGNIKEYNGGRGGYEIALRWRMHEPKKR